MDYYHQIFCRFRKCKRKVPPPSPLSTQKLPFTPPKEDFSQPRPAPTPRMSGSRFGVTGAGPRSGHPSLNTPKDTVLS